MKPVRTMIFAKAPLPGVAKTRLSAALGEEGAARLALRLLRHAVVEVLAAGTGPVELCVTPDPSSPVWASLGLPEALEWSAQGKGDLGERLAQSAQTRVLAGDAVLLVGTDCPSLTSQVLRQASAALQEADCVLVPATDGGYVLLGLNRFDASLFENIPWSTDQVAATTLKRLQHLGWRVQVLPALHDIDERDDLQWLPVSWQEQVHA